MKKLLLFLLCFAPLVFGQSRIATREVVITPYVGPTTLDSLSIISGATTLYSTQKKWAAVTVDTCIVTNASATVTRRGVSASFAAIRLGSRVTATSAGIPATAYVLSRTNDTTITLSEAATGSGATVGDTLSFSYPPTRFGSVVTGDSILGAGIAAGTTVTKVDTTTLTLSKAATATNEKATLSLSYFTSAAYATGDLIGFPFAVYDTVGRYAPLKMLQSLTVIDNADQGANLELVLFNKQPASGGADNVAAAFADTTAGYIIGVIPITTWYNYGANQVASEINVNLAFRNSTYPIWGQLVCRGSPTYTASNDLTLKFLFLTE